MTHSNRIMFLRDGRYFPTGCLAINVDVTPHGTNISYQLSTLNPADKFNRAVARQLALGRLVESPILLSSKKTDLSMHDVSFLVMKDVAASKTAPHRAVKSAKLWIRYLSDAPDRV